MFSIRAMAIDFSVIGGKVYDGVLLRHIAIPITVKIANTHDEKDTLRPMENVRLCKTHKHMPATIAMAHHIYNVYTDGAIYCHAIPVMSGKSNRMKGA